jgi:hypothetical protein
LPLSGGESRGAVLKDLNLVLLSTQKWAGQVYPHCSFLDFMQKLAKLNRSQDFQLRLNSIRFADHLDDNDEEEEEEEETQVYDALMQRAQQQNDSGHADVQLSRGQVRQRPSGSDDDDELRLPPRVRNKANDDDEQPLPVVRLRRVGKRISKRAEKDREEDEEDDGRQADEAMIDDDKSDDGDDLIDFDLDDGFFDDANAQQDTVVTASRRSRLIDSDESDDNESQSELKEKQVDDDKDDELKEKQVDE